MKILLIGASGFLGSHLLRLLASSHDVMGTRLTSPGVHPQGQGQPARFPHRRLDVRDARAVRSLMMDRRPEIVVNCAAAAKVAWCEANPEAARRINVEGAKNVAGAARETGAFFIHFSTDLVFDGRKGNYSESDTPAPLGVYARSKLESERAVLHSYPDSAVVRLAWMYGPGSDSSPGFAREVLRAVRGGKPFRLFTDQYRSALYSGDVAPAVDALARKRLGGLLHFGGPDRVTRWEFGRVLADVFQLDSELLAPVKMNDLPADYPRPPDCSLDSTRIVAALSLTRTELKQGLTATKRELDALKS